MRVIKSPPLAFDPDQTGDLNKDLNKGLVKRLIENPDLNGFRSTLKIWLSEQTGSA